MTTNSLYESESSEKLVGLNIRVDQETKTAFEKICEKHKTTMSKVLRKFMEQEVLNSQITKSNKK